MYLRYACGGHVRLVVKNPAKVIAVGKHLGLVGQVGATAVHQVDTGQAVLPGDLLRSQMLLDSERIVGAALHRGIVRHDHALLAVHGAHAGHNARREDLLAAVAVQRRHLTYLQE